MKCSACDTLKKASRDRQVRREIRSDIIRKIVGGDLELEINKKNTPSKFKASQLFLSTAYDKKSTRTSLAYLWTLLAIFLVTLIGKLLPPFFDLVNIALLYLLPVLISAAFWGRGPSFFASFFGVLAFDFFFVPPIYSFTVTDLQYLFTFAVYLLVAFTISTMAAKLRNELEKSRKSERLTAELYALSRQMAVVTDLQQIWESLVNAIAEAIDGKIIFLLPNTDKTRLIEAASSPAGATLAGRNELGIAQWVLEHGQYAGRGTGVIRESPTFFLPVKMENRTMAVLAFTQETKDESISPDQLHILEAFSSLAAVGLIRVQLAEEAEKAKWLSESEKLHTALLNSVSHEIRTPLASITGAVTSLLVEGGVSGQESRDLLLRTIKEEAQRLNRFTANLLDMTRLESGILKPNVDWCDMQDVIGVAIREIGDILQKHALQIDIPAGLPLVKADFALIEHVVINLLENAVKYSPPDGEISISLQQRDQELLFSIMNTGLIIPVQDRNYIFDKFYRMQASKSRAGVGLGLSICKGIIEAHKGKIWVESSKQDGNCFIFSLPIPGQPSPPFGDIRGAENAA
jgi:two-component system sensor histidine kinase KdpD